MTSASSIHETGHSKLVLRDNAEGCGGEGDGREAQDGGSETAKRYIKKTSSCRDTSTDL